ncbi:peptidase C1 [bacterium]|nr:peptidase C1 [bacterium]
MKIRILYFSLILTATTIHSQIVHRDSAFYVNKFIWDHVDTLLTMDFSQIRQPESPESFNPLFHFPPIRQDTSGTCWVFCGTSFLESEIYRLHGKRIKLSEMYTVYWEYMEKARRFVQRMGDSYFGQGSEEDAVPLRMKQYGAVRAKDYSGLPEGQKKHNHRALFHEMNVYLDFIQSNNLWDEALVLNQIRLILDKHMGKPPEKIKIDDTTITPQEYLKRYLRLPLDDYVSFISFLSLPFYTQGEYQAEDNWWHEDTYYNVPLNDWYTAITGAVRNGYTVAIGGDVSEPGKGRWDDICVVPAFDIPPALINQSARELRFYNKTSTDDHGIHLVGCQRLNDYDWFLMKDSGSSAYDGKYPGYYFYRDDFVKLKMLTFMVHRDAVKSLLIKCQSKDQ